MLIVDHLSITKEKKNIRGEWNGCRHGDEVFFLFLISNNFINEKRNQKGTPEVYMLQRKN